MLANTLKTTAIAALLGLGVIGASSTAASAYTIKTRCDGDDCVRLQCNDLGDNCFQIGYTEHYNYDRPYRYTTRTYTYTPDYDDGYGRPRYYDNGAYPPPPGYYSEDDYDYPG